MNNTRATLSGAVRPIGPDDPRPTAATGQASIPSSLWTLGPNPASKANNTPILSAQPEVVAVRAPPPHTDDLVCRVCHFTLLDEDARYHNELISPCKCTGSTKWVHRLCLEEWRNVNRGRKKAYSCEICKQPYSIISIKPGFLAYIVQCWTPSEKLIYGSAFVSIIFTLFNAIQEFKRDWKKNPKLLEKVPAWKIPFRYYLHGWTPKNKTMMYMCLFFIVMGHRLLFQLWRTKHAQEIIVAKQSEFPGQGVQASTTPTSTSTSTPQKSGV